MSPKIYRIVTGHEKEKEYAKRFLKQNVIAIGWTAAKIGDISKLDDKEIDARIDELKINNPTLAKNALKNFKNMEIGDYVIAYQKKNIIAAVGIIKSDYYYDDSDELGSENGLWYPHRRKVEWLENPRNLDRRSLPDSLSKQLGKRSWTVMEINYNVDDLLRELNNLSKSKGLRNTRSIENFKNFDNDKLQSILTALKTKPFLILAGVSGTGKTQIARIVAGVMSRVN